jgi:hypothetical protein
MKKTYLIKDIDGDYYADKTKLKTSFGSFGCKEHATHFESDIEAVDKIRDCVNDNCSNLQLIAVYNEKEDNK